MRLEHYSLNVVQAGVGTGTAFPCRDHLDKWVQVTGIAGGAAVTIEGTIDGATWVASTAGSLTANGIYEIPEAFDQMRVNRTVQGTGNPSVLLAGRQGRSD